MAAFAINVLLALLSSVAGAALGWLAVNPDRIPQWMRLHRREWTGRWWCVWQHPDDLDRYIIDEGRFSMGLGTLKFTVSIPGDQFEWEARGAIRLPYYVGEFWSKRERAAVRGTFTFRVLPQGDKMVGYFTGPTTTGDLVANSGIWTCDEKLVNRLRRAGAAEFARALAPALRVGPLPPERALPRNVPAELL